MKIEDVLKLVDAGFSKADIIALASGQVQTIETQPNTQQEPDPEPQQQPQPTPEPQQTQNAELSADIADIKLQLNALQKSNLLAASQPAGANKKETMEDVWKDFFEGGDK